MQGAAKDGLARLLEFIAFLRSEGIYFSLESREADAVIVAIGLQGLRMEVKFKPEQMTFAYFPLDDQMAEESEKLDILLDRFGETGRSHLPGGG